MKIMNENLVIIVLKYGNAHTVETFKERTPYVDSSDDNESKETSPKSKQSKTGANNDFSGAMFDSSKKSIQKKNTHLGIIEHSDDDQTKLLHIYGSADRKSEVVYSDLLQRLMVFITNVKSVQGLWRDHILLLKNLTEVVHLFYMPEIHHYLVPLLFEFILEGNNLIKDEASNCLAKIMKYQHHTPDREELIERVIKELAQASNWNMRKSYVIFCKHAINYMPKDFFKKHFINDFIACSSDKVPHVRREFVTGLLSIKPYFDSDVNLSLELMDLLNNHQNDPDREVREAVEQTDFELLQ